MIKKFSEEASINNLGSVQYDREQKYMSEKDKAQARNNIGIGEVIKTELEEVLFANLPITNNSIRVSFSDKNYDPNEDERKSSFANMTGTWTKCRTSSANIWDYVHDKTSWASVFYDGTNVTFAKHGWFGLPGNFVKIISTDFTGATNFSRAFSMCHYITELWSFNNDLTVDDVSYFLTFNNNTYLEKIPDLLDFSNGSSVGRLFQACTSLRKIKEIVLPSIVGGVSNNTDGIFYGCKSLTTIEKPVDLHNITTHLDNFVCLCVSLTHLEFINQPDGLVLTWAFGGCQSLTTPIQLNAKIANGSNAYSGYVNATDDFMMKISEFPDYDFSTTTNMKQMCSHNTFKVIPELNCPLVTNVNSLFSKCTEVEAGMLRAYAYLKSLGAQITDHKYCFDNCGINTESGRIERKYIPQSWGGDGPEEA